MLTENLIRQLQSENELLQLQLQDVNEMIQVREEELDMLREKAAHAVMLQSRLDMNLDEFYQMQDQIGKQQEQAAGAARREYTLEDELVRSIDMETELYNIRDELASTKAAFADVNAEVEQTASLYRQIAALQNRVAELESNLEIATLEHGFQKEELEDLKKELDK